MSELWFEVTYWWHRQLWRFLSTYCRWLYDWHIDYGHPYWQPWPGEGGNWGPRHEWVCSVGDWLTAGWLHD